jgi:hypothetical protein
MMTAGWIGGMHIVILHDVTSTGLVFSVSLFSPDIRRSLRPSRVGIFQVSRQLK